MRDSETENPKTPLMESHPPLETPLHRFEPHAAAVSIDFSTSSSFGFPGQAFIAQYGAEQPVTTGGKFIFPGQKVSRLDMTTMQEQDFYLNTKRLSVTGSPNRPVLARFSPEGQTL